MICFCDIPQIYEAQQRNGGEKGIKELKKRMEMKKIYRKLNARHRKLGIV